MRDINTTPKEPKIERACLQVINVRPSHIPRLELCIPQAAVNAVLKIDEEITKPERFFDVFTAIKCIVSLFGLFHRPQ